MHTIASATVAGRSSCCGRAWRRRTGSLARLEHMCGSISQASLAWPLSALGAFAEGRRHGEEALRLATLDGRGQEPSAARALLGHLYLTQGDLEHAIQVLEPGLALCRASGNRNFFRI